MKKNGKKHRKLQKEKALNKSSAAVKPCVEINQRVRGVNTALLSVAQILGANPIVSDSVKTKREYLERLMSYLLIVSKNTSIYASAAAAFYEKTLFKNEAKKKHKIGFYKYFILFDLIHFLGYDTVDITPAKLNRLEKKYLSDFPDEENSGRNFRRIIKSVQGRTSRLTNLAKNDDFANETEYIELIKRNLKFMRRKPYGIAVTATMSAGKSTFINALTGKYVSLVRTMACTGRIHTIINKSGEDGLAYEYDRELLLDAESESTSEEDELNRTEQIAAAVRFNGILGGKRLIVTDSPGVNYNGNEHHQKITKKMLTGRNYNLLIYVMNATQLSTDDESAHLDLIKETIGDTPVIFVINKADAFNVDKEDISEIIGNQIEFLEEKGFKAPMVCPVSAKAAYFSKTFGKVEFSRLEERELYNLVDKFEKMKLTDYYDRHFKSIRVSDQPTEEKQLLKTCGFAYVEKIIKSFMAGGY